jgi:hypothetical protein
MTTNTGEILIQGYTLSPNDKEELNIPEGEDVVSIPEPVMRKIIEIYTDTDVK